MTKFAIDDRLDDVDIHLGGRFDPRHLSRYPNGGTGRLRSHGILRQAVEPHNRPSGRGAGRGVGRLPAIGDGSHAASPPMPKPPSASQKHSPSLHGRPYPASGMDARRVKTRDAGLQLRREPGSGRRRPTPRKTVKLAVPFDDAGMSDSDHPANRLTSMPPVET